MIVDMRNGEIKADEVMNYKGLSAYLKLSQGTLRHKVMGGSIPFFKIGGSVRFSKKKIDEWLEGHHRAAQKEKAVIDGGLFAANGETE